MQRRTFLKTLGAGVWTGAHLALLGRGQRADAGEVTAGAVPDLVAVKNGEPEALFDRGIEALGGMGRFVKKGQRVVVKPNIGWNVPPERAANTNPRLVRRIVEHCLQAGAREVYVFDHTCDDWRDCYRTSGIEQAVKEAGGKIAPGNSEGYFQQIALPHGQRLRAAKEHELILGADVVINVPVLKSHGGAKLSVAMKNLMGVVWDRGEWHANDLPQCIADFTTYRKPDLNVVDAYNVLQRHGPRGVSENDVVRQRSQLLTTDLVTADAAAAKLFGVEPDTVDYIRIAHAMGVGRKDLENLVIRRIVL
ncbi:MAG TPA: DUF362 domain-containing protein [Candidatus Competibacteraceae bacterium]|nr:MAG: DUF362 domain-containing protein [Candidatus Competibacteraceae bacterium]HOB60768.1 DUF362 domain-containing protein [Candidatus Competibacteraceae bacterium]HQA25724.1 DUF362 domain-containing protein [Candidatus Competibacteraceae bacterium]HQD56900.1 DUF362 domain-containing protein [Candidatus Competibacteraceae bacterium]